MTSYASPTNPSSLTYGISLLNNNSLAYQILVYYQIYYSLIYFCLIGLLCYHKWLNDTSDVRNYLVNPILYIVWCCFELLRVYLGYTGNINERIDRLSASLLLTVFPQIGVIIYHCSIQSYIYPLERILSILMLIILLFELIFGFISVRKMIKFQTKNFHLNYQKYHEINQNTGENNNLTRNINIEQQMRMLQQSPIQSPNSQLSNNNQRFFQQTINNQDNQNRFPNLSLTTTSSTTMFNQSPFVPIATSPLHSPSNIFPSSFSSSQLLDRSARRARDQAIIRGEFDRKSKTLTATNLFNNTQ